MTSQIKIHIMIKKCIKNRSILGQKNQLIRTLLWACVNLNKIHMLESVFINFHFNHMDIRKII